MLTSRVCSPAEGGTISDNTTPGVGGQGEPPGWYADPWGRAEQRWWNGFEWSDQTRAAPVQQLPVEGWYDDPDDGTVERWWDGRQWTDHTRPASESERALIEWEARRKDPKAGPVFADMDDPARWADPPPRSTTKSDGDAERNGAKFLGALVAGGLLIALISGLSDSESSDSGSGSDNDIAASDSSDSGSGSDNGASGASSSVAGDYRSDTHYVDEVADSSEKMWELMIAVTSAVDAVSAGTVSYAEFADLMAEADRATQTHINFFEDREPPSAFAAADRDFIRALNLYGQAFRDSERCVREGDTVICERALDTMEDAGRQLDATADSMRSAVN